MSLSDESRQTQLLTSIARKAAAQRQGLEVHHAHPRISWLQGERQMSNLVGLADLIANRVPYILLSCLFSFKLRGTSCGE